MKRTRQKKLPVVDEPAGPFNNPFSTLVNELGTIPVSSLEPLPASPPDASPPQEKQPEYAVIRLERAGRGGKEVTLVEQLELDTEERARWHKELKRALGCGGAVEGEALMFQGDHRQRLRQLLKARGIKSVKGDF